MEQSVRRWKTPVERSASVKVVFTRNSMGKPPDYSPVHGKIILKRADAELVFLKGPLEGMSLTGFTVYENTWKASQPDSEWFDVFHVNPPERAILFGPDKFKSYALLRPTHETVDRHRPPLETRLHKFILQNFIVWWREELRRESEEKP